MIHPYAICTSILTRVDKKIFVRIGLHDVGDNVEHGLRWALTITGAGYHLLDRIQCEDAVAQSLLGKSALQSYADDPGSFFPAKLFKDPG